MLRAQVREDHELTHVRFTVGVDARTHERIHPDADPVQAPSIGDGLMVEQVERP